MRNGSLMIAAVVSAVAVAAAVAARPRPGDTPVKLASSLRSAPLAAAASQPNERVERLWRLLEAGGQVVLMRHATTTPGTGDPPNFKLDDCSTQRNLSDAGRAQAKAIGEAFRGRGVTFGDVRSSQWCRCVDTARLVANRAPEQDGALNSMFNDSSDRDERVRAMLKIAAAKPVKGNALLVTHQVNITAVTDEVPAMGEMVVVTPDGSGGFRVAGRLRVAD